MKNDIHTWLIFLDFFNGVTSYQEVDWTADFDLQLFTDSAGSPDMGVWCDFWVTLGISALATTMGIF
jgi:hypothetical protein